MKPDTSSTEETVDGEKNRTVSGQETAPGTDFPLVSPEEIVFHKDREDDFDYQIPEADDFDW